MREFGASDEMTRRPTSSPVPPPTPVTVLSTATGDRACRYVIRSGEHGGGGEEHDDWQGFLAGGLARLGVAAPTTAVSHVRLADGAIVTRTCDLVAGDRIWLVMAGTTEPQIGGTGHGGMRRRRQQQRGARRGQQWDASVAGSVDGGTGDDGGGGSPSTNADTAGAPRSLLRKPRAEHSIRVEVMRMILIIVLFIGLHQAYNRYINPNSAYRIAARIEAQKLKQLQAARAGTCPDGMDC